MGEEEGQAAATGELVARAVAVVLRPVTFMRVTITRRGRARHRNFRVRSSIGVFDFLFDIVGCGRWV
ncbi:hypothetical protein GCM10010129_79140 [Streptomyces fumigatiscleroticus]|nr:hypothetical protein GCM10010129_79140 [Streptomyces fumigatiscleroticus]